MIPRIYGLWVRVIPVLRAFGFALLLLLLVGCAPFAAARGVQDGQHGTYNPPLDSPFSFLSYTLPCLAAMVVGGGAKHVHGRITKKKAR